MDFDRAKIYEVSTSNIAHTGYETLNTNTPWDTEECEEWLEGSIQNHTKKGLQFHLEVSRKKRERAIKDVWSHIDEIYESLWESADRVKPSAYLQGHFGRRIKQLEGCMWKCDQSTGQISVQWLRTKGTG